MKCNKLASHESHQSMNCDETRDFTSRSMEDITNVELAPKKFMLLSSVRTRRLTKIANGFQQVGNCIFTVSNLSAGKKLEGVVMCHIFVLTFASPPPNLHRNIHKKENQKVDALLQL